VLPRPKGTADLNGVSDVGFLLSRSLRCISYLLNYHFGPRVVQQETVFVGLLLAVILMKSGCGHPARSLPIAVLESYSESPFLFG
jgi:hypothetical protein